MLRNLCCSSLLSLPVGKECTGVPAVAAAPTPRLQSSKHRPGAAHISYQEFQQQNPRPEVSLIFAHRDETWQRLCKEQLLPAVSCYQMQASPSPPPKETSAHCRSKQRSLDGIHVLLMRGLESLITPGLGFSVKHSHSLQLSGFSRRNVGG